MVFRQSYDRRRLRPSYRMSRTSASDPLRTFPAGLWCRVRFVPVCLVSVGSVTASAAFAQTSVPVEGAAGAQIQLTPPQTCSSSSLEGEIVVCGKRSDRYRIAKEYRSDSSPSPLGRPRTPLSAEDFAPCGIFQGERRCGKREAAQYGYGEGRDPISVGVRIISALSDPDK
jgi:hypothetical protein